MMYHPKQPRAPEGQQIGIDGDDRKPLLDRLEGGQFKMRLTSAQGTIQEPVQPDGLGGTEYQQRLHALSCPAMLAPIGFLDQHGNTSVCRGLKTSQNLGTGSAKPVWSYWRYGTIEKLANGQFGSCISGSRSLNYWRRIMSCSSNKSCACY